VLRYTIGAMAVPPDALAELAEVFGERLSQAPSVLDLHGRDESSFPARPPDAVAFPHSTAEVASALAVCARHGVPVVPFGVGTSLEGQVLPVAGGLSLDLSGMDRILEINPEDLDCRVQPGVRKDQVNERLRDAGLFFAVDPGADATIGGMAATGASGTMTVRYGTIRENVLGLEVVLADGSVVRTGSRARKSAAGYDLTHLFIGSEGTLGVITELTVRLHGIPERVAAARVSFPSVAAAADTAIAAIQSGIALARCELLDTLMVQATNAFSQLDEPESPALFVEFHGSEAGVREQVAAFEAIAADFGGSAFRWATRTEDRTRLWNARHDAYFAQLALRPGCRMVTTDACVPVSRLAECIAETNTDIATMPFPIAIVGHVADGNFHCGLLIDPADEGERAAAKAFTARLAERAIAMGGTCTGEHGVGLGKMEALRVQYPAPTIELMAALKRTMDPAGIMNPGKVV
jgi:D-lactate dehydrogenase (cytochrome)